MVNSANDLDIHLFADDSNIFCTDKSLLRLETWANAQLVEVHNWLWANKLSLNIEKSNCIIFHPLQKMLNYEVKVILNDHLFRQEFSTS